MESPPHPVYQGVPSARRDAWYGIHRSGRVSGTDPLNNVPLANLEINVSGVGIVYTDSTGSFTVNINSPTPVTLDLVGEHCQRVLGTNQPQVTGVLNPGGSTTFRTWRV